MRKVQKRVIIPDRQYLGCLGSLLRQPVLQQHFAKMLPWHTNHPPILGPQYLEVRIWSLTKIMAEASYGHEPHEFQAGALGIYVFHHGYCLGR